jgi:intracellular septation protein A
MNASEDRFSAPAPTSDITPSVPFARSVGQAAWQALSQPGRISGIAVTAVPAVAFVSVYALSSLYPALIAAGVAAIAGSAWRLQRRQPVRHVVAGLLVVAACAAVAAATGQERDFFLIPTLIPFIIIMICLVSVLAKRPVTGLILNRILRGPARWSKIDRLRRVYAVSTLSYAGANVILATVQTIFYLANNSPALAAAHIAAAPVFAIIVAVTIVFARRAAPARDHGIAKVS